MAKKETHLKISALIITYNEEKHLDKCLSSLKSVADEIIVVDSYSTDRTVDICNERGVKVVMQKFLGYREQKNFAIEQAQYEHILSLDGDEALSDQLQQTILDLKNDWQYDGYYMNRRNRYCGQWIKHSDWYPDRKLRLFKKGSGMWKGINPHDTYVLKPQFSYGRIKGDLLHYVFDSYSEHNQKIEKFSSISAQEYYKLGKSASFLKILFRPSWAFFKAYFLRGGFLDGFNGFMISVQTANLTFLKYSKLRALYKTNGK